ncbi:MAG: hypothetical protein AVDCRST_MAG88-589, partial [uncultured Thermomicrobiales bacterium]
WWKAARRIGSLSASTSRPTPSRRRGSRPAAHRRRRSAGSSRRRATPPCSGGSRVQAGWLVRRHLLARLTGTPRECHGWA